MIDITLEHVWAWINEGCNANEIAAYAQTDPLTAEAWMSAARKKFASLESQAGSVWKV